MFKESFNELNYGDIQESPTTITPSNLENAINSSQQKLLNLQHDEGYWWFELEADCTITAEYIMMMHYIGDIDINLQNKMAVYLRARQTEDGSYPLFTGGSGDISCSVKVYYALKLAGDTPYLPHMAKLRKFILSQGGAAKANVFTRIALATFEQVPWRAVPYIPVEIMLLPKWFPFHLDKVSYWSRVVMVPLFILCTLKAKARNPQNIDILELFITHPDKEKHYFPKRGWLNKLFLGLDKLGRITEPLISQNTRNKAIKLAEDWFIERLNGEDGLGAIFPAMVNAYEALLLLGYSKDDPKVQTAKKAIDKMLVTRNQDAYCQPCLSPIWDTSLTALALQEADKNKNKPALTRAYNWFKSKQLSDEPGDWRIQKPDLAGGGWAFEFENPHYPDVDDTAVVAFAMADSGYPDLKESVQRATNWVVGMQSQNGGHGAFDADNTCYYLNEIPFADHGALLDPPTADVSARCLMLMSKTLKDMPANRVAIARSIEYLRNEQEADGSWFGRWGTNYVYGTWSVLMGLEQTDLPKNDPMYTKAVQWLKSVQHEDGGWGEGNESYHDTKTRGQFHTSTAFQTAWAVLALLAAGEKDSSEVKAGIQYLLRHQLQDGSWKDDWFTAPGFPKVFYLIYHGYNLFFPLWALARYRNELNKT